MLKRKGAQWAVALSVVLLIAWTANCQRPAQRAAQTTDRAALRTDREALAALRSSRSELHKAAIGIDREALTMLLQSGADPNAADAQGRTPLHGAVTAGGRPGNTTAYGHVKTLLQYGADPSRKDSRGITPLDIAVLRGSEALVEELIAAGGDPNRTTPAGVSLLALAEMLGNDGAAAVIKKAGGVHGSSPSELALVENLPKLGEFSKDMRLQSRLMSRKENKPTPQEIEEQTMAAFKHHFELDDNDPKIVEFRQHVRDSILDVPAPAAGCDDWNSRGYSQAATAEKVADCLRSGAELEARNKYGRTPLHHAVWFNADAAVAAALLEAGAVLEARDKYGRTPLHYAAMFNGNPAVTNLLMEAGADPNVRDQRSRTPLHGAAIANENLAVITALLDAGAELDVRSGLDGGTPLHRAAAANENAAVIDALLDAGADPEAQDRFGKTPWDHAMDRGPLKGSDAYRRLQVAPSDPGRSNGPKTAQD